MSLQIITWQNKVFSINVFRSPINRRNLFEKKRKREYNSKGKSKPHEYNQNQGTNLTLVNQGTNLTEKLTYIMIPKPVKGKQNPETLQIVIGTKIFPNKYC